MNQVIQLSVYWICTYIAILKLQFRSKLKSDLSDTPTPIVFNTFTYKTLWSEIYSTISSNHVCSITVLSYNYVLKCWWIKVIHVFVLVVHFHPLKAFKGIGKALLENLTDVQRMFYVIKCKTTCLFTSLLDFLKCWFWNLVPNKQWSHGLVIHVHGNLYKHVFYLYVEQLEIQFLLISQRKHTISMTLHHLFNTFTFTVHQLSYQMLWQNTVKMTILLFKWQIVYVTIILRAIKILTTKNYGV